MPKMLVEVDHLGPRDPNLPIWVYEQHIEQDLDDETPAESLTTIVAQAAAAEETSENNQ